MFVIFMTYVTDQQMRRWRMNSTAGFNVTIMFCLFSFVLEGASPIMWSGCWFPVDQHSPWRTSTAPLQTQCLARTLRSEQSSLSPPQTSSPSPLRAQATKDLCPTSPRSLRCASLTRFACRLHYPPVREPPWNRRARRRVPPTLLPLRE